MTNESEGKKKPKTKAKPKVKAAPKIKKLSRADKSVVIRQRLFKAATEIVGNTGYADASIGRITEKAGVAQGTFYNYFESRQDLFDQLLPALGKELLDLIRKRVNGLTGLAREEQGLRAWFDFLIDTPEFYRVLNEAEVFAPKAYYQHMDNVANSFQRALKKSWHEGRLGIFEEKEIETIVYILLSARQYLSMHYSFVNGNVTPVPEHVISGYMKLFSGGIFSGLDGALSVKKQYWESYESNKAKKAQCEINHRVIRKQNNKIYLEMPWRDFDNDGKTHSWNSYIAKVLDEVFILLSPESESENDFMLENISTNFTNTPDCEKLYATGEIQLIGEKKKLILLQLRDGDKSGSLIAFTQATYLRR